MPRISTAENGGLVPVDLAGSAGLVLDVSPTGLLVHSLDRLAAGSCVDVGLWVAGSDTRLLARADVVWSDESGRAGLNLVNPPPQWAARIAELIGWNAEAAEAVQFVAPPHSATIPSLLDLESATPPPVAPTNADFLSLVEQALSITEADGAALALQQNDGIYCVASSGRAPAVGARLNPVSGISGECYRSARAVVCNDAEHDARINPEAARRLNLRSLAVVPVLRGGQAIGLLQVLSQRAAAFSDVHVELLDYIAEQAAFRVQPAPAPVTTADHTVPGAPPPPTSEHLRLKGIGDAAGISALQPSAPPTATELGSDEDGSAGDFRTHAGAVLVEPLKATSPSSDPAQAPSFAMVSAEGSSIARWTLLALLCLALAAAAFWYFAITQRVPVAAPPPPPAITAAPATSHAPAAARRHPH